MGSGNKTQITILENASGQAISPMFTFQGKQFNPELLKGEIPGTIYGTSLNGWIDQGLFTEWFLKHYFKHTVAECLLPDSHSSYYTLEVIKAAAEKDVIMFCLPPHTYNSRQPTTRHQLFWSSQEVLVWYTVCYQYMSDNPSQVTTKFQFSSLLMSGVEECQSTTLFLDFGLREYTLLV